jgi:ribonuclease BN (tRNA processing enzyme)
MLPLYGTPGVLTRLGGLEPDVDLRTVFDFQELPGTYRVGPFELSGLALPHYVPNVGVRLRNDDVVLAYTGDTGPDPLLAELGRDSDLYIVEATDRKGEPRQRDRNLLTSEEAGYWAARAGARRLLLTHFWPGNDRAAAAAAARSAFDGEVLVADEDLVLPLGPT